MGALQVSWCLSRELCGRCPHPRAPGALALSLDGQGEGSWEGKKPVFTQGVESERHLISIV
jgi:hypothetical protein